MNDVSTNGSYQKDPLCLSVEEIARDFIENLLESAVEEIRRQGVNVDFRKHIVTPKCLVQWPSVSDFTPDIGLQKVDEYIRSWPKNAEMMYCIDYTGCRRDSRSDFHFYEGVFCIYIVLNLAPHSAAAAPTFWRPPPPLFPIVKWSVPNMMYPVPPAVASVFFTMELSRIKPLDCPVTVTYIFEGSKLKHSPGDTPFPLKWVWDIIWNKVQLFKTLSF
ncbi:A-kinase anchor protein 14-like [Schistocerca piceifrons]|uniref:A-kinase anchor protein 14-like n=1 Tax=Schistocerca piceifrons TaxID=274613 RepID=UPI001F5E8886|nr:A-kinase anchor protein 14-like [Schistocerca piceifrons]